MAEPFSEETQSLLDAADRAIVESQELVAQRRSIVAECGRKRRQLELRWLFERKSETFARVPA